MAEAILERLRKLAREAAEDAEVQISPEQIDDRTFLPDVFDSLGLSALLTRAEEEWNITFSDEELTPDLFESLPSLAAAIESKVAR